MDITFYRAVLFDMDGVVTDTMPIHFDSWRAVFEPYGVTVSKMDVYIREGLKSPQMARQIAADKSRSFSDIEIENIVTKKSALFERTAGDKAQAFEGVKETLKMLRGNGIKTALVTGSSSKSAKTVIKKAGLEGLFDVIVTGDDTKKGKPDPEPYKKAIEKLGVNRLNCIVIENAPLGIKAAKAAGVDYVIAVTTSLDASYLSEADDVMDSFSNLEQCLARRFAARPGKVAI